MSPQFVLEVVRFKLSSEVWKQSISRRVVAFIEGSYKNKIVKSNDAKVMNGSKYCIPWTENIQKVQMNFFFIDDLLTMDIGTALYLVAEDRKFVADGSSTEVLLHVYPNGATVPIGRALVKVQVQAMFADEQPTTMLTNRQSNRGTDDHTFAVPGFRFKRLSRVLHWERIRSLNISQ